MGSAKWTEAAVIEVLREAYLLPDVAVANNVLDEWALLHQIPLRHLGNDRRIDALAVRCWSAGRGFERIAFEVKVSRQDFRNETPEKRAPSEAIAHLCTYVAPAGIIPVPELPPGWGLIEVYDNPADRPTTRSPVGGRGLWKVKPKRRKPVAELDDLAAMLARRASRAEQSIRSGEGGSAAEVARLRAEHDRLSLALYNAEKKVSRAAAEAREARYELLGLAGDQECADCGQKVTWRYTKGTGAEWVHTKKIHDKPCNDARREKDRLAKEAETGSHYGWGFAAPVEPKAFREKRLAQEVTEQEAS
jgi:hypothetical protein